MTCNENLNYEDFYQSYVRILNENGLGEYTDDATVKGFYRLTELLLNENKKTNLTAITGIEDVITKHYADCLKLCPYIEKNARLLDVGCGGGFPTLPLAIARPDITITALDSTAKKLDFVAMAAKELSLNVTTLAARAEEKGKEGAYREKFDVVTARAVSRLNILSELCLPFVRIGGMFISMKGSGGYEETEEAAKGITLLGGKMNEICSFEISGMKRVVPIIKKVKGTDVKYPRMYSKICKSPL